MHINDAVELDRRAVEETIRIVRGWDGTDAERPTPCAGWTLTDLLAHCTVQQRGFARAARGERTTLADWAPVPASEPLDAYEDASKEVLAAFAALADPDAPFHLPELRQEPVPARLAVGFHLVDNVVHAWDLAVSVGTEARFDQDVLQAALGIARAVPDDEQRDRPGAAFGHARAVPERADAFTETLLLLGRDPSWRPGRP